MKNLENIKTLFEKKGKFDKKKKINRYNKPVKMELLNRIESGITSEDIAEMKKSGFPIFQYQTQITIHGLFPALLNNYIHGYKNIFQNKNRSIGIKYNAIDEDKRRIIARALEVLGFTYSRNSTEINFIKIKRVTEENYNKVLIEMQEIFKKIDTSLFYGGSRLFAGSYMGMRYLVLSIHIGAIFEKDIKMFLKKLDLAPERIEKFYDDIAKRRAIEYAQYEIERKKEQENERKEKKKLLKEKAEHIKYFDNKKIFKNTRENGIYLSYYFQKKYAEPIELKFCLTHLKGKKMKMVRKEYFETLDEALSFDFEKYTGKFRRDSKYYTAKASGIRIDIDAPERKEKEKVKPEVKSSNDIKIIDYSQKAVAVIGNTKAIKETLKSLGGKFNPYLKVGAGWIFPKSKRETLLKTLF